MTFKVRRKQIHGHTWYQVMDIPALEGVLLDGNMLVALQGRGHEIIDHDAIVDYQVRCN